MHGDLRSIKNGIKDFGLGRYAVEAHNKLAQEELDKLLKRRSLVPDRTFQEIITLTKRVVEGDLAHADNSTKTEILYWASRLHASKTETLPLAREYLKKLQETNSKTDTRIIDALILETEGDADGALRILRGIDNPDGRSTFFVVYKRKNGEESALLWFDEQPERDYPEFFTGIGWANLAITFAKKGRWTEAAERLVVVQDYSEQWPDLSFIEGVVNAALLLPDELRPYALEMGIFHQTIRTVEGSEADKYRDRSKSCFDKSYKLLTRIDQKGRAQVALDWHLWLRLTDSRPENSQDAMQEVSEGMKEQLREIFLSMSLDVKGRIILDGLGIEEFRIPRPDEYDSAHRIWDAFGDRE